MSRRTILIALGGFMFFGLLGRADEIEMGAALPSVTVADQDGQAVDLAAAGGTGWTLVYFYPKADTPGCTKQACSLRDSFTTLSEKGVRVFGVSGDDVAAQKAFQQKYKLPFQLLADTDKKVMDAFGVPHKLGFASRQAYLFRDGELVWRDLSASTAEQAADVLAAISDADTGAS
ncbi:MAG TPA: peroxiredoxin [Thermoanaerobaculia bacterium]